MKIIALLLLCVIPCQAQTCRIISSRIISAPSYVTPAPTYLQKTTTTYQPTTITEYVYQPRITAYETTYPGDTQAIARKAAEYRQLAEQLAEIYQLGGNTAVTPSTSAAELAVLGVMKRGKCDVCHGQQKKGGLQLVDNGRLTDEYDAAAVFDACFTGTMPKGGPTLSREDTLILYNYGKEVTQQPPVTPDVPSKPQPPETDNDAPVTPFSSLRGRRPVLDLADQRM